ncbi:peptidase S1 and S6, chymotrypsin/Hap [Citreicella sp. SE45]|nr:peptidase S1 and S6, chymotrypsin/Hap [Citreicella sp. SE45]
MVAKRSTKKRVTELDSFMEQTNGGGSPENVEGFNFFRAATAGFRQETLFGPTVLRDRPDGGFFSDAGPSADDGRVPGPMSEKVIGYDNRARIGETAMLPWRCICHLEVQYDRGPVGFGTGFIAGENLLLTAAHVLIDRGAYGWQEKPRIARRVRIAPGRDATLAPYGAFVVDIPEDPAEQLIPEIWHRDGLGKEEAMEVEQAALSQDYAGIRLDREVRGECIGKRLGHFGFKEFDSIDEKDREFLFVNTAGYPHSPNKPYGTLWYNAGRTAEQHHDDAFIDYMVDTEGGQSGSPVWFYDKRRAQRFVIAIHTTGDFVNRGLLIKGEIFDTIRAWRAG